MTWESPAQNASPRLARVSDAAVLCVLINSAYRGEASKKGWTTEADLLGGRRMDEETLSSQLAAPGNAFLVLEEAAAPIASVFLQHRMDHAYLGLLSVSPERQAGGWGRRALAAAEAFVASEWGLPRIEMTVIRQRPELIAWYGRRGYVDTGRREPFSVNDERFGIPKVADLEFAVLEKLLV